jgi:hypothetical protein
MSAMNMKAPSRTHASLMCMSQAEVGSGNPPLIDQAATGHMRISYIGLGTR